MSKLHTRPKGFAKANVGRVVNFINTHPEFRRRTVATISRLGLLDMTRRLYFRLIVATHRSDGSSMGIVKDIAHLSPRAQRIHADIKAAFEKSRKAY